MFCCLACISFDRALFTQFIKTFFFSFEEHDVQLILELIIIMESRFQHFIIWRTLGSGAIRSTTAYEQWWQSRPMSGSSTKPTLTLFYWFLSNLYGAANDLSKRYDSYHMSTNEKRKKILWRKWSGRRFFGSRKINNRPLIDGGDGFNYICFHFHVLFFLNPMCSRWGLLLNCLWSILHPGKSRRLN